MIERIKIGDVLLAVALAGGAFWANSIHSSLAELVEQFRGIRDSVIRLEGTVQGIPALTAEVADIHRRIEVLEVKQREGDSGRVRR